MLSTKSYAFIGFGLIGGSMAKRLKRLQDHCRITVCSRTREKILPALEEGVVSHIADSVNDPEILQADVIFLCTPVETIGSYLKDLSELLPKDSKAILTDVGSTKSRIMAEAASYGLQKHFIGAHPMAGSERSGYAVSKDSLLENAFYILTPFPETPEENIETMKELASLFGAIPMVMDAETHDYSVAGISHVPHLIAASLVELVRTHDDPQEIMKTIAAGGFKDITRIASSSPEMWEQICNSNQSAITSLLDEYISSLTKIREEVKAGNGQEIYDLFQRAGTYRNSISNRQSGPIAVEHSITCDIEDEAGAIATIATLLAFKGISIKNIGIVHNRDGEEGVLKIEFRDEESKEHAAEVLRSRSYTVFQR